MYIATGPPYKKNETMEAVEPPYTARSKHYDTIPQELRVPETHELNLAREITAAV